MVDRNTSQLQRDIQKVARILQSGGYSYDQSKYVFAEARKKADLSPPKRKKTGAVDRLTREEMEAFLQAAYEHSGRRGLMMRTLFETGTCVSTFVGIEAEDLSFADLEIRVTGKGDKDRDVPILSSLANELRLHLGERRSGPLFRSRQGRAYSKRRIQQIVRDTAKDAGITKRVYPHLLRHTVTQYLADRGMPEELLQQFLGHSHPQTTQVYYTPKCSRVKTSFQKAMNGSGAD